MTSLPLFPAKSGDRFVDPALREYEAIAPEPNPINPATGKPSRIMRNGKRIEVRESDVPAWWVVSIDHFGRRGKFPFCLILTWVNPSDPQENKCSGTLCPDCEPFGFCRVNANPLQQKTPRGQSQGSRVMKKPSNFKGAN